MEKQGNAGTLIRLARFLERESRLIGVDLQVQVTQIEDKLKAKHENIPAGD